MMNFKHILLATALMGLSACATTAPTPVDNSLINSLKFSTVNVKFAEDRSIPTVYDNAVKTLIDTGEPDTSAAIKSFMAYVDANGGSGTENDRLAERYLEYRIAEEVKFGLSTSLNGTKPIDVLINVEKVQTPNAATMLLVGEVKGIEYDLDVVNSETKEVVLDGSTFREKYEFDRYGTVSICSSCRSSPNPLRAYGQQNSTKENSHCR